MQTAIIILAAGKGTRMKSKKPKVLHEICNRPMLGHVLDTAAFLSPEKIITVVGDGMEEVENYIKDISEIVVQKKQLGTADAVKPALVKLKNFKGNIIILYADTPLILKETLLQMLKKLESSDLAVLGFHPDDTAEYGRLVINENGNLDKIVEYREANPYERDISLCNSGVIAIKSDLLEKYLPQITNNNSKGEYYLTDIVEIANKDNKICSYVEGNQDEVLGVNNRVQLSEAEYIFQQRLRYAAMLEGATLIDPSTVYLSYDTKFGEDVIIHPNVFFGPGVLVEPEVEIRSYSHIEGAKIKSGARIGPFARIRPGSEIGNNVHIGNFVEIKKSKLHKEVKIGHLTYIGDAEIGEKSNIGAGTVTCNYDGYNKYQTKIGKAVFIGSNSALIAPVNIGDKAFVGAGSTITKNVSSESLAVARNRQINKENWAKSFRKKKGK